MSNYTTRIWRQYYFLFFFVVIINQFIPIILTIEAAWMQPPLNTRIYNTFNNNCQSTFQQRKNTNVKYPIDCDDVSLEQPKRHHYRNHGLTQLFASKKLRNLIDSFDLDSIEAYEKQLLLQQSMNDDNNDDVDLDDDDEYYLYNPDNENDLNNNDNNNNQYSTFTIPSNLNNVRLDNVISSLLEINDNNDNVHDDNVSNDNTGKITLSRSQCVQLITQGCIFINDNCMDRKSYKVEAGQVLKIDWTKSSNSFPFVGQGNKMDTKKRMIVPEKIPLNIIYEDEYMLVINKQAGIVVHPGAGNWNGTIVNAVSYYLQYDSPYGIPELFNPTTKTVASIDSNTASNLSNNNNGATSMQYSNAMNEALLLRPGIVHRIDKGTTGILVIAKTMNALQNLSNQFAARTVSKTYLTVTVGNPGQRVVINKPIGRHPLNRQKMRVVPNQQPTTTTISNTIRTTSTATIDDNDDDYDYSTDDGRSIASIIPRKSNRISKKKMTGSSIGKNAISLVDTIYYNEQLAFVQVKIETGRTHQIRVHLQDHNTPIVGDDIYGLKDFNKRVLVTLRKNNPDKTSTDRPYLHAYKLSIQHPMNTDEKLTFIAPMPNDMKELIVKNIYPNGVVERPELFQ